MKDFKDNFTDGEKGKLFALCQDTVMLAALKKAMLADLYTSGVTELNNDGSQNWAYNLVYGVSPTGQMQDHNRTDEQLGQNLRGIVMGITLLNSAFARIKEFDVKKVEPKDEKNPAI